MNDAVPVDDVLWQDVFADAPIAISVVAPDGCIVSANAAFAALFGYDMDELTGLAVASMTRDEDLGWTRSYLAQLVSGQTDEYSTDKVFVRKDGTTVRARLDVRAQRRDGRCTALVSFLTPAVERRPLGDTWFRKVIESINETITLTDAQGNVIETSGRYRRILGYPLEFWEGRSIFDVMLPDDVGRVLEMRDEILANPARIVHTTVRMRNADNGLEVVEVHASNLLDDDEIGAIVLTTRNITAERALVDQLSRRRDEAVAEAEMRSRMVATVSHELRNPLHALQGVSELLARGDLPEASRDLASALDRQVRDLTRVVDDLLTTSRLELGSMTLEMSSVDLRSLCADVVAFAELAAQPGVELHVEVAAAVPDTVETDPVRLRQVLTNLVGNAVKFTSSGRISLVVELPTPDTLTIRVADTGAGIPAADISDIFEPFRSATTAAAGAGAGLGLSIVWRIVALLGGSIEVSSVEGSGATFVVSLPLALRMPAEHRPAERDGDGVAAPVEPLEQFEPLERELRVLVVEDDAVNQQLARAQLRALGLDCTLVGSGEEGVELLASAEGAGIDVVLMDYHLPGIDGVEATRRIRSAEHATGRHVAIVGVTASASFGDRASCLAAGMDDHVPKPVGLADLASAISRVRPGRPALAVDAIAKARSSAGVARAADAVDRSVLATLVEELGDRSIVEGVVATFLGELDGRVDHIVGAALTHDTATVRHWVHTLDSSARMLGAASLAECARAVQRGDAAPESLRPSAARVREELTAWL